MEIINLIKTNNLISKLSDLFPEKGIELEAYSCKYTKHQKKNKNLLKPLRYFINLLELAFINLDFTNVTMKSFNKISFKSLIRDLNYMFLSMSKNKKETIEYLKYLECLINQIIKLKKAEIYQFEGMVEDFTNIYLIYDKKSKRILLVKINEKLQN